MIRIWPGNQGNTFALAKCAMGSLIARYSFLHLIQNIPCTIAQIQGWLNQKILRQIHTTSCSNCIFPRDHSSRYWAGPIQISLVDIMQLDTKDEIIGIWKSCRFCWTWKDKGFLCLLHRGFTRQNYVNVQSGASEYSSGESLTTAAMVNGRFTDANLSQILKLNSRMWYCCWLASIFGRKDWGLNP